MALFRRLLPLYTALSGLSPSLPSTILRSVHKISRVLFTDILSNTGRRAFGRSQRSFASTAASSEESVSSYNEDLRAYETDGSIEDEIEKIRREFDAAKRSFLNIPAALKEMPRMNPEG